MSDVCNLDDWKLPSWHQDYGDAKLEFDLLMDFCQQAVRELPHFKFNLDSFEEGYMCVRISDDNIKVAELYVSDVATKKFGLFTFDGYGNEKEELQFFLYREGIDFLDKF